VESVGEIEDGTLDLGVPVLTARFVAGKRLGRGVFEDRWVRRGRLGRVGRILLESGFEVGESSLVALDQIPNGGLSSRRDLLAEFFRDRRVRTHAAGFSTMLRLGNLDP